MDLAILVIANTVTLALAMGVGWFVQDGYYLPIGIWPPFIFSNAVIVLVFGPALKWTKRANLPMVMILLFATYYVGNVAWVLTTIVYNNDGAAFMEAFSSVGSFGEFARNAQPTPADVVYFPWFYADWLVSALVFCYLRSPPPLEEKDIDDAPGYRGGTDLGNADEATRLLLLNIALRGSSFRRWMLRQFADPCAAVAPQPGLDVGAAARACVGLERRDVKYDLIAVAAGVAAIVAGYKLEQPLAALGILALLGLLLVQQKVWMHCRWIEPLLKGYQPDQLLATVKGELDPALVSRLPSPDLNHVIYRDFDPFDNFGAEISGFTAVIDLSRTRDEWPDRLPAEEFTMEELYSAAFDPVVALKIPGVALFDRVFMNGEAVSRDDGGTLPALPQTLTPETVHETFVARRADARGYRQVQLVDWGGNLVISYFFRFTRIGSILTVEAIGRMLTPLNSALRQADRTPRPGILGWFGQILGTFLVSPLTIPMSAIRLVARAGSGLQRAFGLREMAALSELRRSRVYDFGAAPTLRRQLMSNSYVHAFMKSDKAAYTSFIQGAVIDSLADFLDDRGVSVASLRQQQTTILNSGIIIHGGDINTQALAVGEGAAAKSVAQLSARPAKVAHKQAVGS